jgi:D-amino peptidase
VKSICLFLVLVGAGLGATAAPQLSGESSAPLKLKIYISADMEGVVGAVTADQLSPDGFEYGRSREFMTAEVSSAIAAAYAAGATEIVVSDSHGNGESLLIDKLPKDVTIVRARPRPLAMMAGIDESFDGVIFIGYHTGTHNAQGVRAHTMSSAHFADVRLNDLPMSEASINAAIAGHFGVPVIMVSGDDKAVEETRRYLGDVEGAIVKSALGFHSARTLTPERANEIIGESARRAVGRIADFKPYKLQTPLRLDLRFKNYRPPELLAYLPIVERTDSHSIRYTAKDMVEISKFLEFVNNYDSNLTP